GIFKLGGFTHFIPSVVIKGMLSAIGIILISKQIPLLIGYDKPGFWTDKLFNIFTFNHAFQNIGDLYHNTSAGSIIIGLLSLLILISWNRFVPKRILFLPASFIAVLFGSILAIILKNTDSQFQLQPSQFV